MVERLFHLEKDFPGLREIGIYKKHSDPDDRYNCIAFVFSDVKNHWWPWDEPGYYWPNDPGDDAFREFCIVAASNGYEECQNGDLEPGYEKICAYCDYFMRLRHGARQDEEGWWLSKMGHKKTEDIKHRTPEAVAGTNYGTKIYYFRRLKQKTGANDKRPQGNEPSTFPV